MIKLDNGSEIIPIFPTPIYFSSDCDYKFSQEEIEFISNTLEYKDNCHNLITVTNKLFDLEEMSNLRDYVLKQVENYTKFIGFRESIKFRITDSWANKTYYGGKHHTHHHPNSVISGVISVTQYNKLRFTGSIPGVDRLFPGWSFVSGVVNPTCGNEFIIDFGGPGRTLIFPSMLSHDVPTLISDIERISISFNVFPYGEISYSHTSSLTL